MNASEEMKEAIGQPRKLALYRYLGEHVWYAVFEIPHSNYDEQYQPLPDGQQRELPHDGYARITEPLEVAFTACTNDAVIQQAVDSLNAMERKAIEELNKKIAQIRQQKAQLLALTHQQETVA